ncbi:hypothetical protein ASF05_04475 [Aeromicrobium sp. Leaf245]|nr:hypothetical protein ASF05_04475 [Aeromicrobium sp. Leaf245]KQP82384.1 hypothetical protein ASF35_13295 [Aeromicrobium sp. Leaf291]
MTSIGGREEVVVPVLTFDMPADSGASLCVSTRLLVRAPEVELCWLEGDEGVLVLRLECDESDVAVLRHHVLTAHPAVVDAASPGEGPPARPEARRGVGRHRR